MIDRAHAADEHPAFRRPAWLNGLWDASVRHRVENLTFGLGAGLGAAIIGIVLGLALTAAALRNGEEVGAVTIGSWRLPVGEGTAAINPYQRAVLARTGAIPMSTGQGVALTASRDNTGQRLDRRCRYRVSGSLPRARFWTLAAVGRSGYAIPNAAQRLAFSSSDILRDEAGDFSIVVSPAASPGNWLPVQGAGSFSLVLRLYDSAVPGFGSRELASVVLPTITRLGCGA